MIGEESGYGERGAWYRAPRRGRKQKQREKRMIVRFTKEQMGFLGEWREKYNIRGHWKRNLLAILFEFGDTAPLYIAKDANAALSSSPFTFPVSLNVGYRRHRRMAGRGVGKSVIGTEAKRLLEIQERMSKTAGVVVDFSWVLRSLMQAFMLKERESIATQEKQGE